MICCWWLSQKCRRTPAAGWSSYPPLGLDQTLMMQPGRELRLCLQNTDTTSVSVNADHRHRWKGMVYLWQGCCAPRFPWWPCEPSICLVWWACKPAQTAMNRNSLSDQTWLHKFMHRSRRNAQPDQTQYSILELKRSNRNTLPTQTQMYAG